MKACLHYTARDLMELAVADAGAKQPLEGDRHYMARPTYGEDGEIDGVLVTECDCESDEGEGEGVPDLGAIMEAVAARMKAQGISPDDVKHMTAVNLKTGEATDLQDLIRQYGKPKH